MRVKETIKEVIYGIIPIFLIITILQFSIVHIDMQLYWNFVIGTIMLLVGLVLFLTGVEITFVPMGEAIGNSLVKSGKLRIVLLLGFILGFVATLPEPDVHIFISQVKDVISDINTNMLLISISLGVSIFVTIAFLRIFLKMSMKYVLLIGYAIIFILMFLCPEEFIGMSFDAGGVTTGALTVPFIMSLGIGVSSMISKKKNSSDGFGILGIASIGPIIAMLIIGVICG